MLAPTDLLRLKNQDSYVNSFSQVANGFSYKWTLKKKSRLTSKLTTHKQEIINYYLQFSRPADHSRKCKKKIKGGLE